MGRCSEWLPNRFAIVSLFLGSLSWRTRCSEVEIKACPWGCRSAATTRRFYLSIVKACAQGGVGAQKRSGWGGVEEECLNSRTKAFCFFYS